MLGNISCFSEASQTLLMQVIKFREYPRGTHLFWEGDVSDKTFFLKKGQVKIIKASNEGKELLLYTYHENDLIGQTNPFFTNKHTFTAEVAIDSTIGFFEEKDLKELISASPSFSLEFIKWMSIQHRLTQTKFRDLILYGKPGALASTLIRLVNAYGEPHPTLNGVLIKKKITNTSLSSMIGATRESVNRMLSDLRKQEVISYENSLLIVHDIDFLRKICHCENCPSEICRI